MWCWGGSGDATWRLLARQAMLLTLTSHYRTSPNKVTFRATSSLCLLSARVPAKDTPPHGKQFDCHLDPCNPEAKHGEGAHRTGLRTWGLKTMFILRQLGYFSDRSTTVALRKRTLGRQYFSTRTESRTLSSIIWFCVRRTVFVISCNPPAKWQASPFLPNCNAFSKPGPSVRIE